MKKMLVLLIAAFSINFNYSSANASGFSAKTKTFIDGIPTWTLKNISSGNHLVTVTATLQWDSSYYYYPNSNRAVCTLNGLGGGISRTVDVNWNYGTLSKPSPLPPTEGLATVTFVGSGFLYTANSLNLICQLGGIKGLFPKSSSAEVIGQFSDFVSPQ